jgi:hypothetical protein
VKKKTVTTGSGGSQFIGAPSFSSTSMAWAGSCTSRGSAIDSVQKDDEQIELPLSPGTNSIPISNNLFLK